MTLSFTPSDEQAMLVDAINKYAVNEARKVAHEADESGDIPADVLNKGWQIGLLPAAIPEQYGGFAGPHRRPPPPPPRRGSSPRTPLSRPRPRLPPPLPPPLPL